MASKISYDRPYVPVVARNVSQPRAPGSSLPKVSGPVTAAGKNLSHLSVTNLSVTKLSLTNEEADALKTKLLASTFECHQKIERTVVTTQLRTTPVVTKYSAKESKERAALKEGEPKLYEELTNHPENLDLRQEAVLRSLYLIRLIKTLEEIELNKSKNLGADSQTSSHLQIAKDTIKKLSDQAESDLEELRERNYFCPQTHYCASRIRASKGINCFIADPNNLDMNQVDIDSIRDAIYEPRRAVIIADIIFDPPPPLYQEALKSLVSNIEEIIKGLYENKTISKDQYEEVKDQISQIQKENPFLEDPFFKEFKLKNYFCAQTHYQISRIRALEGIDCLMLDPDNPGMNKVDIDSIRDAIYELGRAVILDPHSLLYQKALNSLVSGIEETIKGFYENTTITKKQFEEASHQISQIQNEDPFWCEFFDDRRLFKILENSPNKYNILRRYPEYKSYSAYEEKYSIKVVPEIDASTYFEKQSYDFKSIMANLKSYGFYIDEEGNGTVNLELMYQSLSQVRKAYLLHQMHSIARDQLHRITDQTVSSPLDKDNPHKDNLDKLVKHCHEWIGELEKENQISPEQCRTAESEIMKKEGGDPFIYDFYHHPGLFSKLRSNSDAFVSVFLKNYNYYGSIDAFAEQFELETIELPVNANSVVEEINKLVENHFAKYIIFQIDSPSSKNEKWSVLENPKNTKIVNSIINTMKKNKRLDFCFEDHKDVMRIAKEFSKEIAKFKFCSYTIRIKGKMRDFHTLEWGL